MRVTVGVKGVTKGRYVIPVAPEACAVISYDPAVKVEKFLRILRTKMMDFVLPGTVAASLFDALSSSAFAAAGLPVTGDTPTLGQIGSAAGRSGIWAQFQPLVAMVQDFALPVGVVVATWGLIEVIMGNLASGKEKVKYSIIGFIGVYVIPMVFEAIRAAFHHGA